jgi:maltokinase
MSPEALGAWLAGQRWFAGKTGRIERIDVEDAVPVGGGALQIAAVTLEGGRRDRYVLAVDSAVPGRPDALDDAAFARALLDLVARSAEVAGRRGRLLARRTPAFPGALPPALEVRRLSGEQSNTSLTFGDQAIMKVFRRLAPGLNPETELTDFLTTEARFAHTPALWGVLDYAGEAGAATLAVVQALIPGAADGWQWVLGEVRADPAATLPALGRLGEVTGALHVALAGGRGPSLAPEPITDADLAAWAAAVRAQLEQARRAAGAAASWPALPDLEPALAVLGGRVKTRHHGDFHLGQTLRRPDGDWVIIDFEGEPLRPIEERRRKHTPLRDVAGLLRSLDYAAATAGAPAGWQDQARERFVAGYLARAGGAPFLPAGEAALRRAVAVFEVEKAAYEILYEASHRPKWLPIPLRGLVSAVARLRAAPTAGAA